MNFPLRIKPAANGQPLTVTRPDTGGRRSSAELIVSSLTDGIIYLDEKGLVESINPVMEELLGTTEAEARGRSVKELTGDPEICLLITLSTGRTTDTFRVKGREFKVEGIEVYSEDGSNAGTITLFHDVTDVRTLERQRKEVMSMITHDLKAPLTAIIGHADLILEGGLGEPGTDVRDSVEAIERSGQKLLNTINDFLTISKLQAGQFSPVFQRTLLGEIAAEVVAAAEPDATRAKRSIRLDVEPGLPEVECDPGQVERVIANLLSNAVKYTKPGGRITVGVRSAKEPHGAAGEMVEIYVEDDGIGIPECELANIFERYWRGGCAGRVKGTGLGLAIVKSIVEAHHGRVGVASVEKKGSRFHVLLPVVQPAD